MTDAGLPSVSVIIPAFNAERFVDAALASVRAQLVDGVEVIVVDDGSTDGTVAVVSRQSGAGVVLLQQPNTGPAAARNHGLAGSRGSMVAFLDADDEWPEGTLASRMALLSTRPDVDVVLGRTQFIGDVEVARVRFNGPEHTVLGPFLGCGLFRRSAFDRVGPFDATLATGEDYDWFLRAREAGLRIATTEHVTLRYRVRPSGISRDEVTGNRNLARALLQSLQRRRAENATGSAEPLRELFRDGESTSDG